MEGMFRTVQECEAGNGSYHTMAVFTRQDWELFPIEPSRLSRSSAVSIMVDSCSNRNRFELVMNPLVPLLLLVLLLLMLLLLMLLWLLLLLLLGLLTVVVRVLLPLPLLPPTDWIITLGSIVLITFFISIAVIG